MKSSIFASVIFTIIGSVYAANPKGIDVSNFQTNINWKSAKDGGIEFAYIKATEGTDYINPEFSNQYTGATKAGIIRGAYHFAQPSKSSGAAQARYFLSNGGGWSSDGRTLPGALDLEDINTPKCYGLSTSSMINWIKDFSDTYNGQTGRYPVIYTTTSWWKACTGNSADFGNSSPLWISSYASSAGTLPAGWSSYTFWQNSDSSPYGGDADQFNGDSTSLKNFASNK